MESPGGFCIRSNFFQTAVATIQQVLHKSKRCHVETEDVLLYSIDKILKISTQSDEQKKSLWVHKCPIRMSFEPRDVACYCT